MSKTLELSDEECTNIRMALRAWGRMIELTIDEGAKVGVDHALLKKTKKQIDEILEKLK